MSEAALPAPAASLALDGVLYRGAVAAHAAAVAAVDRECGGGFPVAAEARLLAALGAAVDRACGVDGAPPLLARLCRFRKTQERAVVQAVVAEEGTRAFVLANSHLVEGTMAFELAVAAARDLARTF